jgi:GT2 family glycosyltransferase
MKLPLFSIITVTYNASEQLQATIDSVVSQTHGSVEYIVITKKKLQLGLVSAMMEFTRP